MTTHTHNFQRSGATFICLLLLLGQMSLLAQTPWRGYVDRGTTDREITPCNMVNNGILSIPRSATGNQSDYWTNFEFRDTLCVVRDFVFGANVRNIAANGGISAYDLILELVTNIGNLRLQFVGQQWAQSFTRIEMLNQTAVISIPTFVRDFSQWSDIRLQFQNNSLSVFQNNQLLYVTSYTGNICQVLGLKMSFRGSGEVQSIGINELSGTPIYQESFNSCATFARGGNCGNVVANPQANTPCVGDTLRLRSNAVGARYRWTGPNGFTDTVQNPFQGNAQATQAGIYRVQFAPNVCQTAVGTVQVQVNPLPVFDLGADTFGCFNSTVTLSAANANYPNARYRWRGGESSAFINTRASGVYTVTLTDANGCAAQDSVRVSFPTAALAVQQATVQQPTCNARCDGWASVTASGSFGLPYRYRWSNPTAATTPSVGNLCAGTYVVTATDWRGCTSTTNVQLANPPAISAIAQVTSNYNGAAISCFNAADGAAKVQAAGGTGSLQYRWSNAARSSTTEVTGLAQGKYTVSVTDANGCLDSAVVRLNAPTPIVINFATRDATCYGDKNGSLIIGRIAGGTPTYQTFFKGQKLDTSVVKNLAAGRYELMVRDVNQCTYRDQIEILQPPPLEIQMLHDTVLHFGDSLQLYVTPQAPAVTASVRWQASRDSQSLRCPTCAITWAAPRRTASYNVTLTTTAGCVATQSLLIQVDKQRKFYAPTAFSPNSDGMNDFFTLYCGSGTQKVSKFRIFDRWGNLLYDQTNFPYSNPEIGWDGTSHGALLEPDTFVWAAEILFEDGESEIFSGDVTLLR
jgi:gliding motility-associated-like protein